MTPVLENPYLNLASRLLLGYIFLAASVEKVADPAAFALLIENYRILSPWGSLAVATVLPWIELVSGLFLIVGLLPRGSSLLIAAMTATFTVAVISGLFRGLDISCGCFTVDPDVSRIGWTKVAENAGMVVLSVFLVYSRAHTWSVRDLSQPAERTSA